MTDANYKLRPFYFMVPFWGRKYREYFVDRCLPSLLAPNNLPLLNQRDGHRFLIAAPCEDWQAIASLPILNRLRCHAAPTWIEIEAPSGTLESSTRDQYSVTIRHQDKCRRILCETAYAAGGYGCALLPDIIVSDGMVAAMLRSARNGDQLLLCMSLRQVEEGVLQDLLSRRLLPLNQLLSTTAGALTLSPRLAAEICVRHLHPELESFEEASPDAHRCPPFCIWRVPGDRGIIMHTHFAVPILMDFTAVSPDHLACLDRAAFENIYVFANFSKCKRMRVLRDSDEFVMLSLTPLAVNWSPPTKAGRRKHVLQRRHERTLAIRRIFKLYAGSKDDRIKHEIFRTPFRYHSSEIDEVFAREERRIRRQVQWAAGDYLAASAAGRDFPPRINRDPRYLPLDIMIEQWAWPRILWSRIRTVLGAAAGNPEDKARVRQKIHKISSRFVGRPQGI
jgi:hypothetical protein